MRETGTAAASMSPRGRATTRDALLNSVDEIVAERGLAGCTLQAVARRAGLTTGAVYSTFGSRGALLAASMLRRVSTVGGLPDSEPDLARAVTAYAREYHRMATDADAAQLMLLQLDLLRLGAADPAVADATREAYQQVFDAVAADFARRLPVRWRGPGPDVLAYRLLGVLQGLTLQRTVLGVELGEDAFTAAALAATGLDRARSRGGSGPRRSR